MTTAQLGMVTGVALFGALFLEHAEGAVTSAATSADAFKMTCLALAASASVGALAGPVDGLVRRVRRQA